MVGSSCHAPKGNDVRPAAWGGIANPSAALYCLPPFWLGASFVACDACLPAWSLSFIFSVILFYISTGTSVFKDDLSAASTECRTRENGKLLTIWVSRPRPLHPLPSVLKWVNFKDRKTWHEFQEKLRNQDQGGWVIIANAEVPAQASWISDEHEDFLHVSTLVKIRPFE